MTSESERGVRPWSGLGPRSRSNSRQSPVPDPCLPPPSLRFDNSYARELQGFSVPWRPAAAPAPKSLFFNAPLADELGLDVAALAGEAGAAIFAGNAVPDGAEPLAQAYAGHQFGGFSPQLGDGRALLLGEVIDRQGRRRDIAFKGSGRTPFARGGDGKAAVGPDAARGADRRGDARARHPDHARARGRGDGRAGLSRDAFCPARC